jgi:hypothetical protein
MFYGKAKANEKLRLCVINYRLQRFHQLLILLVTQPKVLRPK